MSVGLFVCQSVCLLVCRSVSLLVPSTSIIDAAGCCWRFLVLLSMTLMLFDVDVVSIIYPFCLLFIVCYLWFIDCWFMLFDLLKLMMLLFAFVVWCLFVIWCWCCFILLMLSILLTIVVNCNRTQVWNVIEHTKVVNCKRT